MMKEELFNELCESVREGAHLLRGDLTLVKMLINRITGDQESVQIEINDKDPKMVMSKARETFNLLDERCSARSKMLLASMKYVQQLDAESQMCLKSAIDILFGRHPVSEDIEKNLRHIQAGVEPPNSSIQLEVVEGGGDQE